MSQLIGMVEKYYLNPNTSLTTALSITGTSTSLYGMAGAKRINQGDLASVNGAILLAGVPLSIYVGNKIISENVKNDHKTIVPFKQFGWMAAPMAVSLAVGVISWFVPAKKEAPKFCYDSDDDDSDSDDDYSDSESDASTISTVSTKGSKGSSKGSKGKKGGKKADDEEDDE